MKLQDVILRDTRANQPAAASSNEGWLYYVTDEDVLERSSGSAWEQYAPNATTPDKMYYGYGRGYGPEMNAATTEYSDDGAQDSTSTTETDVGNIMPVAGVVDTLYLDVSQNSLDAGSIVVTLMKNGVATTLTKTVAFGVTSITVDSTHSFSVAAGDRVSIRAVTTGATGTVKFGVSYLLKPTA
jgi:hypothetical protein